MQYLDCEQGTPLWAEARTGRGTSSNGDRILTPTGKPSTSREDYACEIISEKLVTGPDPWKEDYQSADMQRGTYREAEARKFLDFELDLEVKQIGCIIHDNDFWLCSPDGLIGDDGLVEIKCPKPSTQVRYFLDGVLPAKYRPQVHSQLVISGRAYVQFLSYCPGLPPLLVRVERDEYTVAMEKAWHEFTELYRGLLAKVEAARTAAIDAAIARRGDQLASKKDQSIKAFVA